MYRGPYFAAIELMSRWACGVFSGRLPPLSEEPNGVEEEPTRGVGCLFSVNLLQEINKQRGTLEKDKIAWRFGPWCETFRTETWLIHTY